MKKFFSLLLALTLVVGMLTAFTASAAVNTTVFYNALNDEQITSLDGVTSIYATTTFTGRYEDNASVIVSHYAANGKLTKVESIVPVESTIGASVTYTTPEISVADTDIIKIFAWTGVDTIKPLLKFPGVISRSAEIPRPTATVSSLNVGEITEVPLTFAMNFKADPVTEAQLLAYGNWYADFELKVNKDVTFNLDGTADGYLAGQYDSWSPAWVQVPKKDVTLAANTPLKIMETGAQTYGKPGLKYTCQEVFDRVKDFDCGVFFTQEFLEANPDLHVTLELRMYNPLNEAESYLIGETYEFTCTLPTTTVTVLNAEELGLDYALNFSANEVTDGQLSAYADWKADYVLTVNKDLTLNANGTKDAYLAGQYDEFGPEFVKMPATETAIAANEAVSVLGLYGANITFRDVVETVKDFDCGIKFSDSFLAANPDVEAKLELRLYHPSNNGAYYVIGESYTFKQQQNITEEAQVLTYGNVTAEVPAGVLLNKGVTELTLTTTALENSESGVEAGANETLSAMDVHVEGVSEENTTPIIVTLKEATEPGYNKGNLSLFHVEDGVAVPMEEVETKADLVKHNQFTYDPADGTIAVALANFSEIALLATNDKVWNGEYDYSWYSADKTTFEIANADQMAGFSAIVGGMNGQKEDTFLGKTVKLIADLDFGGIAVAEPNDQPGDVFYPVGYYNTEGTYPKSGTAITSGMKPFEGTFDGNGHTIANIFQTTWIMKGDHNWYTPQEQHYRDGMGIFGKVYGGTIKNLTVDNFISVGEITTTGVIASYAESWNGRSAVFENIALTNCNPQVYNIGNGGIVGSGGWYSQDATDIANTPIIFRNITVDNTNKISALWGSWDVACAGIMGRYYPDSNCGVSFENCHVAAQIDVYNDVCGNYQYYWYRYAGMMIGTVEKSTTDEKGYTVPDLTGITAKDCTVHFGDWNNYYYCELVDNSLASYTHDHQFSRLTEVKEVNGTTITYLDGTTGTVPASGRANYVVVNGEHSTENATCYHFLNGAVWKHEDAGYETFDLNGDGELNDLKEDRQHYYLPFNQLFQGDGWGVKNIPVYNGEDYAFEGITILDRVVADSVVKFESKHVASVNTGTSLTVGDLFKVVDNGVDVVTENVQVAVSPVIYEGNTANATINVNDDWTKSTINFTGYGKVEITITDYYFCTPTTIVVDVEDTLPSIIDDGEAFVKHVAECGGMIALPNAGSNMITVHTADNDGWFSFKIGVPEDDTYVLQAILLDTNEYGKVYGNGITFTHTDGRELAIPNSNNEAVLIAGNWHTIGEITLEEGNHTFIVENNDPANGYSFWAIRLVKPEDLVVDKFVGKEVTLTHDLTTIESGIETTLGELFGTVEGAEINSATVTVNGINATVDTANWANTPVVLTGTDAYTITITDGANCNTATTTVTLNAPNPVDKWVGKTNITNLTLATYGTAQTISFNGLFDTKVAESQIKGRKITVSPSDVVTINQSTGAVTVPGSAGEYKVTVTDDFYSKPATATIRIVNPNPVIKWKANTGLSYEVDPGATKSLKLSDIFTLQNNYKVGTVTYTVGGKSYNATAAEWANTSINFAVGTHTVTIVDDLFCTDVYTATVTVNEKQPVDKFTGTTVTVQHTLATLNAKAVSVKLGDIFTGTNVVTGNITVTIAGKATTVKASDWANATITVPGGVNETVTITINDNNLCNTATGYVKLTAPATVKKWNTTNVSRNLTIATVGQNQTFNFTDLFSEISGTYIGTLTVTVSGNGSYSNGVITVPGTAGEYTVTVKDNNYSKPASAIITLNDAEPVTKFTVVGSSIKHTQATWKAQEVTTTLGAIFGEDTTNGQYISGTVTYTIGSTAKTVSAANWASTSVSIPGGVTSVTVKIKDDNYCNETTATVKLTAPSTATKWTAKSDLSYEVDAGATKTLTLGDIFAAHSSNGKYIAGTVTYTVGSTSKTVDAANWASTSITVGAGETKVTIKDNNYSKTTEATVTVTEKAPVEKFTVKDDYYFVAHDVVDPGSSNVKTIKLGDIFAASGEGTINSANVTVTTSNKVRKIEATINKNASDWTQTTIDLKY
ncbi:MAG: hypothetical protein E7413_04110, partial [Ruminococcaceae bacterium]|nr:hypothetical protein [Oscillospiraceae bacterium]